LSVCAATWYGLKDFEALNSPIAFYEPSVFELYLLISLHNFSIITVFLNSSVFQSLKNCHLEDKCLEAKQLSIFKKNN